MFISKLHIWKVQKNHLRTIIWQHLHRILHRPYICTLNDLVIYLFLFSYTPQRTRTPCFVESFKLTAIFQLANRRCVTHTYTHTFLCKCVLKCAQARLYFFFVFPRFFPLIFDRVDETGACFDPVDWRHCKNEKWIIVGSVFICWLCTELMFFIRIVGFCCVFVFRSNAMYTNWRGSIFIQFFFD